MGFAGNKLADFEKSTGKNGPLTIGHHLGARCIKLGKAVLFKGEHVRLNKATLCDGECLALNPELHLVSPDNPIEGW